MPNIYDCSGCLWNASDLPRIDHVSVNASLTEQTAGTQSSISPTLSGLLSAPRVSFVITLSGMIYLFCPSQRCSLALHLHLLPHNISHLITGWRCWSCRFSCLLRCEMWDWKSAPPAPLPFIFDGETKQKWTLLELKTAGSFSVPYHFSLCSKHHVTESTVKLTKTRLTKDHECWPLTSFWPPNSPQVEADVCSKS